MPTILLDPVIVAKRLHTSPRNLLYMEKRREAPPSIKIGKLRRYPEDRLDAWIEAKIAAAEQQDAA
jgi:predicted DNA-binding transcriptional regulator AlpA